MKPILLDGASLTRDRLVEIAFGASVELDKRALKDVARAADFLAEQVRREEPIYGVSTGFGSNADKLLGAHPLRDELPGAAKSGRSLHEELQHNLIVTHAVCVGEPMAAAILRCSTPASCRWCRRWVRWAPPATWRRCRTWPSCCSAVAKPSTRASASPVRKRWRAPAWRRSRCRTRKGWR